MPDFHRNIYYSYRGAATNDADRDRQLENNLTKALVNTLEHCGPEVFRPFMAMLGIRAGDSKPGFALQRRDIGHFLVQAGQRKLLGLTPYKQANICNTRTSTKKISVPDAWIYGRNYAVLIESKAVGELDYSQMQRHREILDEGMTKASELLLRTWADIHKLMVQIATGLKGRDAWLVGQLIQYLEWSNMSEFIGFRREVFDHFVTRDDDDVRKWVRKTMRDFAEKLQPKLENLDSFYSAYDLGQLRMSDTGAWVAFGPGNKEYRKHAHLTVLAEAEGLTVFANIELKNAIEKMRRKMQGDPKRLQSLLTELKLPEPSWIHVMERKRVQASKYDYRMIARIELSALADESAGPCGLEYVKTLLRDIPLPYVSIRTLLDRGKVCRMSENNGGEAVVEAVYRACEQLHELVSYVNEPYLTAQERPAMKLRKLKTVDEEKGVFTPGATLDGDDWIRAGRLRDRAAKGDKKAAAELKAMENTGMVEAFIDFGDGIDRSGA